jgi:hypothetical protein
MNGARVMGISNGLIGRMGGQDGRRAAISGRAVVVCAAAASAVLALAGCGQGAAATRRTVTAADFGAYPGRHAPELAVSALAAANGKLVAVGATAGHPAVWHRTADGAWSLTSPVPARPGLAALASVAYGPAGWLALGSRTPVVLTSADGMSWRSADMVTHQLGSVTSATLTAGPAGYVVIGNQRQPTGACAADIWWSPDLTTWAHAHDVNGTTGSSDVLAVAAGPHEFVSVGLHNYKPAVWMTVNGRAWRTIVLPMPPGAPGAALQQVAVNGRRVVALGEQTTGNGKVAVRPFAEFSADGGVTWHQVPLSSPGPGTTVTALTAVSHGFAAVGRYTGPGRPAVVVWASADGTSWARVRAAGLTGAQIAGSHGITALAASGSTVVGIGPVSARSGRHWAAIVTLALRRYLR